MRCERKPLDFEKLIQTSQSLEKYPFARGERDSFVGPTLTQILLQVNLMNQKTHAQSVLLSS